MTCGHGRTSWETACSFEPETPPSELWLCNTEGVSFPKAGLLRQTVARDVVPGKGPFHYHNRVQNDLDAGSVYKSQGHYSETETTWEGSVTAEGAQIVDLAVPVVFLTFLLYQPSHFGVAR